LEQVHIFRYRDLNLALDLGSGALHTVDEEAFKAIQMLQSGASQQEIACLLPQGEEILTEIDQLRQAGQLFAPIPEQPLPWVPLPGEVKALCLHVAHACNLRCTYCFAGQGYFGGEAALMPVDVGRQAVDFLIAVSGARRHLEIDFFGGEPLLNMPLVKAVIDYGVRRGKETGKAFKFTLTTNGVLLDKETGDYLNRHDVSVILSLDGRREVHDRFRKTPSGRGSYDMILPNMQAFVRSRNGREYYLRGTFTRFNMDFAADVKAMAELGFDSLSLEPVVAPLQEEYAFKEEDLPRLWDEYERLVELMLEYRRRGRPLRFFHFNVDLEGGPCLAKRLSGCGAGRDYLAVTPAGDFYLCHQFVGNKEFIMGSLPEGFKPGVLEWWDKNAPDLKDKKECSQCWARFYCGGGCYAAAYFQNGALGVPYRIGCELERKRLECALYLAAKERLGNYE